MKNINKLYLPKYYFKIISNGNEMELNKMGETHALLGTHIQILKRKEKKKTDFIFSYLNSNRKEEFFFFFKERL